MKKVTIVFVLIMLFSVSLFGDSKETSEIFWNYPINFFLSAEGTGTFDNMEISNPQSPCDAPHDNMCSWYEMGLTYALWMFDTTTRTYSDTFFAGDPECGYPLVVYGDIGGYYWFATACDAFKIPGRGAPMELDQVGDKLFFRAMAHVDGQTYVYALDTIFTGDPGLLTGSVDIMAEMTLVPSVVGHETLNDDFWPCFPEYLGVSEPAQVITPKVFELSQNTPNPFNSTTTIEYSIPAESNVRVEVSNLLGKHVRTLVNEYQNSGMYSISWDGRDESGALVASGSYFYTIKAGDYEAKKRMLLVK